MLETETILNSFNLMFSLVILHLVILCFISKYQHLSTTHSIKSIPIVHHCPVIMNCSNQCPIVKNCSTTKYQPVINQVRFNVFSHDYVQMTFRSVEKIYIVDVIASTKNSKTVDIFLVLNIRFIKNNDRMNDRNVVLIYKNKEYRNLNSFTGMHHAFVPHFSIPYSEDSLKFSVMDKKSNWSFNDVKVKVDHYGKPKEEIAICLYITMYDPIPDVKRFIAYYETVGIHTFIVYLMSDYPAFENAFASLIQNGHMIINRLILPRVEGRTPNQSSQMNSCYYRYRQYFKYIFLCDEDEYLYSRIYPFNLYKAVETAFAKYPKINTFQVIYSISLIHRSNLFSIYKLHLMGNSSLTIIIVLFL